MGGKRRIKEKGDWEENERDTRFQNFLLLISAAAGFLEEMLYVVLLFTFLFRCRSFSPSVAASISRFLTAAIKLFHVILKTKLVSFVFYLWH